jgi:RPA family protein
MNREIAWRVFAGEYNDANKDVSDGGERSPSYVVTPLGAKINRLFVVGVLTDVENVATDESPMWRARLQDPTGTYHVYAGQYQPEASAALAKLKPPAFVAVTGKSRLFTPDSGGTYTSVRPETVKVVDEALRDYWILDACRSLKKRLEALREAYKMDPVTKEQLSALGVKPPIAEGILAAVEHYGKVDLSRYSAMLAEAVRYLLPEFQPGRPEDAEAAGGPKAKEADAKQEALEQAVLGIIGELDVDGKGASWDGILSRATKAGLDKDGLEEVINSLLDKGLVYEPILGRMKRI